MFLSPLIVANTSPCDKEGNVNEEEEDCCCCCFEEVQSRAFKGLRIAHGRSVSEPL